MRSPVVLALALSTAALLACSTPGEADGGAGGGGEGGGTGGGGGAGGGTYDGGTGGGSDAGGGAYDGGVDPACTSAGCLRAVTLVGRYSQATLQGLVAAGAIVENGYSLYTVDSFSDGRPVRATVAIPYQRAVPDGGWHLVANAHGTTGVEDPCAVAGTLYGAGLAGLFGARGLIGVAPDYPGLGTAGPHPYLVARSEGRAVLDGLRAARHLARLEQVPASGRVAVVGLSQGGHAAISAAAQHAAYAPELELRAAGAAGPASVFEEQWRQGALVDGPHLTYHAMLVWAWAQHYGWAGPGLWSAARAADIDALMASRCLVAQGATPALGDALGTSAAGIFSPQFLAAYQSGAWGTFSPWAGWFAENRLAPYVQTAPLRIYQGDADATVLEPHTRALAESLRDGGVQLEYRVVADAGHLDVAFGVLAFPQARTEEALAWLRGELER